MNGLMNALGFLTIIRIPGKYIQSKEKVADSLVYFPLIGLFIGATVSGFHFISNLAMPVFLSIILIIILQTIITGGAHIDGLCDMCDGTFSGRSDKKKILEIMGKSDIGVFGVLAIIFLLMLKISLIYYLWKIDPSNIIFFYMTILFMPAFGRWSMVYLIGRYNNAHAGGSLARIFTDKKNKKKGLYISSIYIFILFISGYIITGFFLSDKADTILANNSFLSLWPAANLLTMALSVIAIFFILLLFISWFFTRRIKGITGDIIGGTSEIMEVLFLFVNFIILKFLQI